MSKIINVDASNLVVGRTTVGEGSARRAVDIVSMPGRGYRRWLAWNAKPDDEKRFEDLEGLYAIVQDAIPEATEDEVWSLSPAQITPIILASLGVIHQVEQAVEDARPNAEGLATEAPAAPPTASSPA